MAALKAAGKAGDVLVRNDTRVIPARLRGRRSGGGKMEFDQPGTGGQI